MNHQSTHQNLILRGTRPLEKSERKIGWGGSTVYRRASDWFMIAFLCVLGKLQHATRVQGDRKWRELLVKKVAGVQHSSYWAHGLPEIKWVRSNNYKFSIFNLKVLIQNSVLIKILLWFQPKISKS